MNTVSTRKALILFAHGARDARWAEPFHRISQLVSAKVDSSTQVHQAFLELMSPTLPELVTRLALDQVEIITVIPVFLGQGGHVRHDLPQLIQNLEIQYPRIKFNLAAPVGENDHVLNAIANACIANL